MARQRHNDTYTFDFDEIVSSTKMDPYQGAVEFDKLYPKKLGHKLKNWENKLVDVKHGKIRTARIPQIVVDEFGFDDLVAANIPKTSPKILKEKVENLNETALKNLHEINVLQTRLDLCQGEVSAETKVRHGMDERIDQLNKQVARMNDLIDAKDEKIRGLNEVLRQMRLSAINQQQKLKHVDPEEVTSRTNSLIAKIKRDKHEIDSAETIDERISEIRELFNLLLTQLNEFDSKNIAVTRTLRALINLDVRNSIFIFQLLSSITKFCSLYSKRSSCCATFDQNTTVDILLFEVHGVVAIGRDADNQCAVKSKEIVIKTVQIKSCRLTFSAQACSTKPRCHRRYTTPTSLAIAGRWLRFDLGTVKSLRSENPSTVSSFAPT